MSIEIIRTDGLRIIVFFFDVSEGSDFHVLVVLDLRDFMVGDQRDLFLRPGLATLNGPENRIASDEAILNVGTASFAVNLNAEVTDEVTFLGHVSFSYLVLDLFVYTHVFWTLVPDSMFPNLKKVGRPVPL